MKTYEISQYQRKPLNESMRQMKSTFGSSSYNYDTYFNSNLQKSVSFDDYEQEERMKEMAKEAKMLRIENAKKTDQINTLQQQINKLNDDQSKAHHDANALTRENEELIGLLGKNKKQLEEMENERDCMKAQLKNQISNLNNQLQQIAKERDMLKQQEQLNKEKERMRHQQQDNMPLRQSDYYNKNMNHQYEMEINKLKDQIDHLYNLNKQLDNENNKLRNNEYKNLLLIEENNKLKNDNIHKPNINHALLDELKNQISKLNNHIEVLEREKKNNEKAQSANKKINDQIVMELNSRIANLNKETDDLNKKLYDMKKNIQALSRDKESLIGKVNQLENTIKINNNTQRKIKSNKDNEMLIQCLKNENEELKHNNQRMRRLIEILFAFANNVAGLLGHDELNIEFAKENIEKTKDFLNQLELEIESLLNNESKGRESKWNQIEEKLLYKPQDNNLMKSNSIKEEGEGEQNKLGKCAACNLGCNASLKGCSPLFVQKNFNSTNFSSNKRAKQ